LVDIFLLSSSLFPLSLLSPSDLIIPQSCFLQQLPQKKYYAYTKTDPSAGIVLGCGMISSTCGQLASYPLALVRTRMQANKNNKNNMLQEIADVARRGGVRALYSGMAANCLKVAPAVSIRSARVRARLS
jgi:hypothetical protein